jgi:hypothetical protein
MKTLKEIASSADHYSFMRDGGRNGVVLAGSRGSVAAWEDGLVEYNINQVEAEAGSTPYWACHTTPCLEKARATFKRYANL